MLSKKSLFKGIFSNRGTENPLMAATLMRRNDVPDRLQDDLAAEQVPRHSVKRDNDHRGQPIGGDDPGQMSVTAEFPHDGRQHRRYDDLVKRGAQHHQHQCAEDQVNRRLGS